MSAFEKMLDLCIAHNISEKRRTFRGLPSYSLQAMTTTLTLLSHNIFQKSTTVSGMGPWAAMYH